MLNAEYLACAAAIVAGLLQLVQGKPWPLTSGVLWGVFRAMVIAFLIVWLFATLYNHLIATV